VRGRKPMPTHIKELMGNPGKRAINKREPVPTGELYAAPEWMSETQREGWAYAITHSPKGLLKQLDRSILSVWVVAEDLHRGAAEKIAQYGLLTKSPNAGLPLQSPYLAILNKQAQIMLKAAAELGFSPSTRSRVQVTADPRDGPFAALRRKYDDPFNPLRKPWETDTDEEDDPAAKYLNR
jgi:P27 family predicted phage terminase small subunit